MNIQSIINSSFGVGFAVLLSRTMPRKLGHWIAKKIAIGISHSKTLDFIPAVQVNQWIVSGQTLTDDELKMRTKEVLKSTAICLFDFYHFLKHSDEILKRVEFDPKIAQYFDPKIKNNAVFVAPHLSNFDFLGQALGIKGYTFQILSYPDPGSGYQWQNKLREECGQIITPTSIASLQQARIRLQDGGNVLTGLDRPVNSLKHHPRFFGQPASLPVAYTHLALQAQVPVVVVSAITKSDGNYYLYASDPIKMVRYEDMYRESVRNAEAVLEIAEEIIRNNAQQWSMFYPVWPQFMPGNSK